MTATVTVEIALTATPLTDPSSLTWTDISSYVESMQTRRGRSYYLDSPTAGSASFVLRNTGSGFEPSNATGPYYPLWREGVPVRATATVSGTTYPVFYGFADSFTETWTDQRPIMTVGCVDALSVLSNLTLDVSWATLLTNDYGPFTWVRLGESPAPFANTGSLAGTYAASSYKVVQQLSPGMEPAYALLDQPALLNSADGSVTIAAPGTLATQVGSYIGQVLGGPIYAGVDGVGGAAGGSQTSIVMFYRPNTQPASGTHAWVWVGTRGPGGTDTTILSSNGSDIDTTQAYNLSLRVEFSSGGNLYHLSARKTGIGAFSRDVAASVGPVAGQTDFIVCVAEAAGVWSLYVNGALVATVNVAGLPGVDGPQLMVGMTGTTTNPFTHTFDEIAVLGYLTATDVASLYARLPLLLDLPSQTSGARAAALLNAAGWPSTLRDLDAGTVTMSALTDASTKTVAAHMQDVADVEIGDVFAAAGGAATFRDATRNTSGTVTTILGEADTENPYEGDIQIVRDRSRVVNVWTVSQTASTQSSFTVVDNPSKALNGIRPGSRSLPFQSYLDASAQASTLLAWTKDAHDRVDSVTVRGEANPANLSVVFGQEIANLLAVMRRTPAGSTQQFNSTVEGVALTWTPSQASATFSLDPYPGVAHLAAIVDGGTPSTSYSLVDGGSPSTSYSLIDGGTP